MNKIDKFLSGGFAVVALARLLAMLVFVLSSAKASGNNRRAPQSNQQRSLGPEKPEESLRRNCRHTTPRPTLPCATSLGEQKPKDIKESSLARCGMENNPSSRIGHGCQKNKQKPYGNVCPPKSRQTGS